MARNRHKKKKVAVDFTRGTVQKKEFEVKLRDFQIGWGFPMDEVMFSKFFVNILSGANIMPWDAILTTQSTYLPDARNAIHTQFVESNLEWLMMLDSDVLSPPWTIDALLKLNKPLSGGWYKHKEPTKVFDKGLVYEPVVYNYINTENGVNNYKRRQVPGEGVERVDGLGAGCLLMRKDLAKALGKRPYDMNAGGEDLVMCKKVYDLGFDIHVDWSLECAHVGVNYV